MQKVYRCIKRWWLRQNIRQRNDYILEYKEALRRHEGSPGEYLAHIERLRSENAHDQKLLGKLQ